MGNEEKKYWCCVCGNFVEKVMYDNSEGMCEDCVEEQEQEREAQEGEEK